MGKKPHKVKRIWTVQRNQSEKAKLDLILRLALFLHTKLCFLSFSFLLWETFSLCFILQFYFTLSLFFQKSRANLSICESWTLWTSREEPEERRGRKRRRRRRRMRRRWREASQSRQAVTTRRTVGGGVKRARGGAGGGEKKIVTETW